MNTLLFIGLAVSCVIFAREWKMPGRRPFWTGLSLFNVIALGALYAGAVS